MANNEENQHQSSSKPAPIIVTMVPFLEQSHLNTMLQLSYLISSFNIPVHYVGSSTHNRQVKLRASTGLDSLDAAMIQFHGFPLPPHPSLAPNPDDPIKFPSHLQPLFEAALHLRQPFAALIETLSSRAQKIIVIYDIMMGSVVQDAASMPKTELYCLYSSSAFHQFTCFWEEAGRPVQAVEIPNELPSNEGSVTSDIMNYSAYQLGFYKIRAGDLYNTCRPIEGKYLNLLEQMHGNNKKWAIGPLSLVTICENKKSTNSKHKCLDWLDKQTPNSVIYISFGTMVSMADAQIKELAAGLEESATKFIWVLRDADKADIFGKEERKAELPQGFEERMKGVGMVVREWAPQKEILGHPSIGGFMSHCGWNSCLESISMGVPMAAWPMHSDQPINAMLVTDLLKIGLYVREWAGREEIVTSSEIKEAVRRLMQSEEGEKLRKTAVELGKSVREATAEGGVSRKEMEAFIAHICRDISDQS